MITISSINPSPPDGPYPQFLLYPQRGTDPTNSRIRTMSIIKPIIIQTSSTKGILAPNRPTCGIPAYLQSLLEFDLERPLKESDDRIRFTTDFNFLRGLLCSKYC